MLWTPWKSPRQSQFTESDEIQFSNQKINKTLTTKKPISGNANFYGELVTTESTAIIFSDFGFDLMNREVAAIEVFLHVSRLGRTQDKTIAFYNGTRRVGKNLADLEATDKWTYKTTPYKMSMNQVKDLDYESPGFGLIVDLQPHTQYPSNVTVYLRDVKMRFKLSNPL